jgi:hypothetical protein
LSSPLSRQLIINLRFNDEQWNSSFAKIELKRRHSINSVFTAKQIDKSFKRSNSLNNLKDISVELSLSEFKSAYKTDPKKCINGCGTPPNNEESNGRYSNKSKVLWDLQMDEEEEDEENETYTRTIKPPPPYQMPSHASYFIEKVLIEFNFYNNFYNIK